jgi:thioredoxin reductase (NADPH)
VFPALTDAQLARVAAHGVEQQFSDGELLWEQGDTHRPMFVIREGELELVHPRGQAEELVNVLGAKEFTGELSLLGDSPAFVRGRARGALRVIRIEHARLLSLLQTDAELSELMMRAFILRRVALYSMGQGDAIVVGSRDSAATTRLLGFLVQNAHPHRYVDVDRDADVQALLDQLHVAINEIPILLCSGDRVLRNPTDAEAADCLGISATLEPGVVHDVVICGAGPSGLSAAVYGASEGLDVLLLEAHGPGGQAASSSKIENYLGFPTGITGGALMARAVVQAEKFGAKLAVARPVQGIHCDRGSYRIELTAGEIVRTRAVIIATGAEYRKLDVADLERFEGVGVTYAATYVEAQLCSTDQVIVVGGGNSAGQAATFLARTSRCVHLLVRGPDLAASMSRYLIRRIEETPNITMHRHTKIVALHGKEHLESVTWRDESTGEQSTHPIRHVFTMAGANPNTEWLRGIVAMDPHGFVLTGSDVTDEDLEGAEWPLRRHPFLFETNRPHIFAIGDVRASSIKRVASAVGEGSVCIQLVHQALTE